MPEMPKLTRRQQDILRMIQRAVREEGAAPTRVEIATAFGFRSPNAAEAHLRALARKGVIDMVPGVSRGIRLKSPLAPVAGEAPDAPGEASTVVLPLIGRVAAGSPILAQEQVETTFPVDARLFSARPDYLLRVRGWSMRDAGIWEGDLLAVRATPEARDGQTVVVRLGDEVTVKRLLRRGTHWLLRAANPDFPDRLVGPGESLEVEGVVVGLVRPGGWD